MSKTEATIDLEQRLLRYCRGQFGCDEVTIGPAGRERVDYLTLDFKGIWRCYEVKVSKSDFHSKARTTFIGNLNYYVMPGELYETVKGEVPEHIGVLASYGGDLQSVKKAKRQAVKCDEKVLYTSMIRSLYRTYECVKKSDHEPVVAGYKREVARLEGDIRRMRGHDRDAHLELFRVKSFLRRRGLVAEYEAECEREDAAQ
ncbi:hypothetical protein ACH6CV_16750 [Bacillota bacterium Meth-B3]